MSKIRLIAFDADDTLWHNEHLFSVAHDQYFQLMSKYHEKAWVEKSLHDTEMRNLELYGYGIKAFTLSMIETALSLTEHQIPASEIQKILDITRSMLEADVVLLDDVKEVIEGVASIYPLILITKGDLRDQQAKIRRSGLSNYFQNIHIVSDKSAKGYGKILNQLGLCPEEILMVGNSLRSDILPILELGGNAAYIPYEITWVHEVAEVPDEDTPGFFALKSIQELPDLLIQLQETANS